MFDFSFKAGATSQRIQVMLRDDTTGAGKTGLAYSAVTASYTREGGTRQAITLVAGSPGDAYSSGKWAEVDATNARGLYQLHLPDAALAAGAKYVTINLQAAGTVDKAVEIELAAVDKYDAVRAGLSALPTAAPGSAGGIIAYGTGAGQLNPTAGKAPATLAAADVTGSLASDLQTVRGRTVNDPGAAVTIGTNVAQVGSTMVAGTVSDKAGYSLTAGEHATIQVDAQAALTSQGYTAARAGYLDTLNGLVSAIWAAGTRTLTGFGTLASDTATAVWAAGSRTLTSFGTLVSDVATAVWSAGTRTLTGFGTLASDAATAVWSAASRTLTDFGFTVATNSDSNVSAIKATTDQLTFTVANRVDATATVSVGNVTVGAYAAGQDPATLVLDAAASSHNVAGTIGERINAAGGAADPLLNQVPGSYPVGSAGFDLSLLPEIKAKTDVISVSGMTPVRSAQVGDRIDLLRGDSVTLQFTVGPLSSPRDIWFTIKQSLSDADAAALLQVDLTGLLTIAGRVPQTGETASVSIQDAVAGVVQVTVGAQAMTALPMTDWVYYDLQIEDQSGTVTTPIAGYCRIRGDVTRACLEMTGNWYADSIFGSDANDGMTAAHAVKTIGKLLSLPIKSGDTINLACNSYWREQLVAPADNVTITSYGIGSRPLLDSSDAVAPSAWSKTAGQTNVYQVSWSPDFDASNAFMIRAWENDRYLVRASSIAACDATPGSMFPSSDGPTAPITVYVHPYGSTDPRVDGHKYEINKRQYAVGNYAATGLTIKGIAGRRGLTIDGDIQAGVRGTIIGCESDDAPRHAYFLKDGATVSDCISLSTHFDNALPAVSVFDLYDASPSGIGASFTRCSVRLDDYNSQATAFTGHATDGGPMFGHVIYTDCSAENVQSGYSQKNAAAVTINGGQLINVSVGVAAYCDVTVQNAIWYCTGNCAAPQSAGVTLTVIDCNWSAMPGAGVGIQCVAGGQTVIVSGSTINVPGNYCILNQQGSGFVTVSDSHMLGGWPLSIGVGVTYTGDYNTFSAGSKYVYHGVTYNTLADFQAASGQDAHSVEV